MTLLREFMTADNFTAAARKLAEPICRRFDLPDVYQLGLVVPNAVAADEAMVRDWGLERRHRCTVSGGAGCVGRDRPRSPDRRQWRGWMGLYRPRRLSCAMHDAPHDVVCGWRNVRLDPHVRLHVTHAGR